MAIADGGIQLVVFDNSCSRRAGTPVPLVKWDTSGDRRSLFLVERASLPVNFDPGFPNEQEFRSAIETLNA